MYLLLGICAPIFGAICDRRPPKAIAIVGAVIMMCSFSVMGPLPFFPFQKSIGLIIAALVLQGIA